jgi:hypothetical protein
LRSSRHEDPVQRVRRAILGTLAGFIAHADTFPQNVNIGRLVDWVHDECERLAPIFALRAQMGFRRECHGDLHAGNIVRRHGELLPFDAIEFNAELRWIDVIDDLAFFFMDLLQHERADLAYPLLDSWLTTTADYDGLDLLRVYSVYRALVRAHVDVLAIAGQSSDADAYRQRARARLQTATNLVDPPPPTLILMHGVSGSANCGVIQVIPSVKADHETMRRTLDAVLNNWDLRQTWGLDWPMIAMTATRLDEPEKAVDFLLWDAKNFHFGSSGITPRVHLDQNVSELLTSSSADGPGYRRAAETYFPSNGSLLLAVGLMVAGGSDVVELNPGFPPNGQWIVHSERIHSLP